MKVGFSMAVNAEIDKLITDAALYIERENYVEAKALLEEYLKHVPLSAHNQDGSYSYTFEDISEYYLALYKYNGKRKIKWAKYKTSEAYYMLSIIALAEGDANLAARFLKTSLSFNPINAYARLQVAEIQRRYQDWDKMIDALFAAYDYICTEEAIAKFFRMLASCYQEQSSDDIALCLYSVSLVYEKSPLAADAVFELQDATGITMDNFSMMERIKLLRNYELPLSVSKDNLQILGKLMRDDRIQQKYPEDVQKVVQRFTVLSSAYDLVY